MSKRQLLRQVVTENVHELDCEYVAGVIEAGTVRAERYLLIDSDDPRIRPWNLCSHCGPRVDRPRPAHSAPDPERTARIDHIRSEFASGQRKRPKLPGDL